MRFIQSFLASLAPLNLLSFFLRFALKASPTSLSAEMKSKTFVFALYFAHLFVTLRQSREVTTSRQKKETVSFVLRSIFRNFAPYSAITLIYQ